MKFLPHTRARPPVDIRNSLISLGCLCVLEEEVRAIREQHEISDATEIHSSITPKTLGTPPNGNTILCSERFVEFRAALRLASMREDSRRPSGHSLSSRT